MTPKAQATKVKADETHQTQKLGTTKETTNKMKWQNVIHQLYLNKAGKINRGDPHPQPIKIQRSQCGSPLLSNPANTQPKKAENKMICG